jgi:hypothetical protein
MSFGLTSIGLLVVAAVFIVLSAKVLFHKNWFLGFLRGFSGFSLLILALLLVLVSINITTYQQLGQGKSLMQISFVETDKQTFEATITGADGSKATYIMMGDTWQVDARRLSLLTANNAFLKAESLTSRYYALEQEHDLAKSRHRLSEKRIGLDVWKIFKGYNFGLVSSSMAASNFLPMANGAVYSVVVDQKTLVAKPSNGVAQQVVSEWQ